MKYRMVIEYDSSYADKEATEEFIYNKLNEGEMLEVGKVIYSTPMGELDAGDIVDKTYDIHRTGNCVFSQTRNAIPVYKSINDSTYKDWGRLTRVEPSKYVNLLLELNICYGDSAAHIIKPMLEQVRNVFDVIPKELQPPLNTDVSIGCEVSSDRCYTCKPVQIDTLNTGLRSGESRRAISRVTIDEDTDEVTVSIKVHDNKDNTYRGIILKTHYDNLPKYPDNKCELIQKKFYNNWEQWNG